MARSPDRKLIMLFTDARTSIAPLYAAVGALAEAHIELLVVVPDEAAARALTFEPPLPIFALDRDRTDYITWWISTLHDRSR
jgi:hypothetical protein